VLGLLGVLAALRDRSYWLPAWFFLVFVFQTRFSAVVATVPFALLAALGVGRLVLPGLARPLPPGETYPAYRLNWVQILALVYIFVVSVVSANVISFKDSVTPDHLAAMSWARQQTPQDSTFIIVGGVASVPGSYSVPEWFPAMADRTSLSTAQGQEWLQGSAKKLDPASYDFLQTCALQDLACLDEFSRRSGLSWNYIYLIRPAVTLADGSASSLWRALQSSPSYILAYQNDSAIIYRRSQE